MHAWPDACGPATPYHSSRKAFHDHAREAIAVARDGSECKASVDACTGGQGSTAACKAGSRTMVAFGVGVSSFRSSDADVEAASKNGADNGVGRSLGEDSTASASRRGKAGRSHVHVVVQRMAGTIRCKGLPASACKALVQVACHVAAEILSHTKVATKPSGAWFRLSQSPEFWSWYKDRESSCSSRGPPSTGLRSARDLAVTQTHDGSMAMPPTSSCAWAAESLHLYFSSRSRMALLQALSSTFLAQHGA